MRISEGYMVREIAGNCVAIPVGQNVIDYKQMLQLNEVGAYILGQLENEMSYEELILKLKREYEFQEEEMDILHSDTTKFLDKAKKLGIIVD